MMQLLKNSIFSKAVQVLLVGYFLMSSLNLANTIKTVSHADDAGKKESVAWTVFKKIFKCSNTTEEVEDGNDVAGCNDLGKIKLAVDYLMPGQTTFLLSYKVSASHQKLFLDKTLYSGILYNKIHLPPPEVVI